MSDEGKKVIFKQAIKSQAELIADAAAQAEHERQFAREISVFGTGTLKRDGPPNERALCILIAQRGADFMKLYGVEENFLEAALDVWIIHLNDRPLRLLDFLQGDVTAFAHDYSRIRRNTNRTTGRLVPNETLCFEVAKH
jgi:hypothetical protein